MNDIVTTKFVIILLLSISYIKFGITLSTLNFNQSQYIAEEIEGEEIKIVIHRSGDVQTQVFFSCVVSSNEKINFK